MKTLYCLAGLACLAAAPAAAAHKPKAAATALDRYIEEAEAHGTAAAVPSPGSAWAPASPFANLAGDVRAANVDDLVTIMVSESATAVSKGTVQTSRQSDVTSSVGAAGGVTNPAGPWANLAQATTAHKLDGQGATTRDTTIGTTLTARVTRVLPNGYLVIEGSKDLQVNSERQQITVRGMARPADVGPGNQIRSDRLAQMEVRINGKGVVGDAIRRPFFLYRLLLGLLPF